MELSRRMEAYGQQQPGLEQYAIKKYAEALRTFPKVLADNCGAVGNEAISNLLAAHQEGKSNTGFDCEGEGASELEWGCLLAVAFPASCEARSWRHQSFRSPPRPPCKLSRSHLGNTVPTLT